MKLNKIARKLQHAIIRKGLIIKLNTRQFYSEEQNRLITVYMLNTPIYHKTSKGEWKYVDYEIISTCSIIEIVQCMLDILKEVGG